MKKVQKTQTPIGAPKSKILQKKLHFLYTRPQIRCFKRFTTQNHIKNQNKKQLQKNLRSIYEKHEKGRSKRNLIRGKNEK